MSRPLLLLLVALTGCMTEQRFREDADAATCAWLEDCFGDDAQECLQEADAAWSGVDEDCRFNKGRARTCVRQLERLACPSDAAGGAMPGACDDVWDCP
jgi:hypothetical protein